MGQLDPNGTALLISDHGFVSGNERSIALPEHAGAPALEHNFHGVFAAKGPLFTDELNWKGLNLLDVAPIVLAAHGLKHRRPWRVGCLCRSPESKYNL